MHDPKIYLNVIVSEKYFPEYFTARKLAPPLPNGVTWQNMSSFVDKTGTFLTFSHYDVDYNGDVDVWFERYVVFNLNEAKEEYKNFLDKDWDISKLNFIESK